MKKLISKLLIGISLVSLSACEKYEEDTLYNKDSAEYSDIVAWASAKCISESKFFTAMTTYADFSAASYAVGDIYRIAQDNAAIITYAKITQINAADMVVEFNSTDPDYDKVVTFTELEYATLQTTFEAAACSPTYNTSTFSFSGLTSSSSSSFTWSKDTIHIDDDDDADDIPETYQYQSDVLKIDLSFPAFLYFHNGTKTQKRILTKGETEVVSVSKITITDVTDDNICDPAETDDYDTNCVFPGTFTACNLTIDTAALVNNNGFASDFLLLDNGCEFVKSNP